MAIVTEPNNFIPVFPFVTRVVGFDFTNSFTRFALSRLNDFTSADGVPKLDSTILPIFVNALTTAFTHPFRSLNLMLAVVGQLFLTMTVAVGEATDSAFFSLLRRLPPSFKTGFAVTGLPIKFLSWLFNVALGTLTKRLEVARLSSFISHLNAPFVFSITRLG